MLAWVNLVLYNFTASREIILFVKKCKCHIYSRVFYEKLIAQHRCELHYATRKSLLN